MDDKLSITRSIRSLATFKALLRRRMRAGYDQHKRMRQWLILGRWVLDTCGNTAKVMDDGYCKVPAEVFPDLPKVMTLDEFWAYAKAHGEPEFHLGWSMGRDMPPAHCKCGVCGKGWTIENAHDNYPRDKTDVLKADGFVGRRLGYVKRRYNNRPEGQYAFATDLAIRSDRFIDMTPDPWWLEKYKENHPKNDRGWKRKSDGIDDRYVIQTGDEIHYWFFQWEHIACRRKRMAAEEEECYRKAFTDAGVEVTKMTAITNEYCSKVCCAPWFLVETPMGTFKIGWRKRVAELNWKATGHDFTDLFKDEDVTKDRNEGFIHCWGEKKIVEYLTKMRESLGQVVPV